MHSFIRTQTKSNFSSLILRLALLLLLKEASAQDPAPHIDLRAVADRGQLVARAYSPAANTGAIGVSRQNFENFYQGSLYEGNANAPLSPSSSYLAAALDPFLASQTVASHRPPALGCRLPKLTQHPIDYSADSLPCSSLTDW